MDLTKYQPAGDTKWPLYRLWKDLPLWNYNFLCKW